MSETSSFTHKFILDKQHFTECFEQTSQGDYSIKAYFKALVLLSFGIVVVLFTDINKYTAWFVFALGILEVLSVKYQKPWWIARQMLSKASNSEVTVTIDDENIACKSFYIDSSVPWNTVTKMESTALGWVIQSKSRFYIANQGISAPAQALLKKKQNEIAKKAGNE